MKDCRTSNDFSGFVADASLSGIASGVYWYSHFSFQFFKNAFLLTVNFEMAVLFY